VRTEPHTKKEKRKKEKNGRPKMAMSQRTRQVRIEPHVKKRKNNAKKTKDGDQDEAHEQMH
jgi:hypothetical protein